MNVRKNIAKAALAASMLIAVSGITVFVGRERRGVFMIGPSRHVGIE